MAEFNNLKLTYLGSMALLKSQTGSVLTLSKIGLGSGTTDQAASEVTKLVKTEILMPIVDKIVDNDANHITLIAKMTNEGIEEGFYWRETGLYFQNEDGADVLFAYSCVKNDDKYDYVPAYNDQRYVKHVRIANVVSDESTINITEEKGLLYVDILTYEEFLEMYKKHVENFGKHLEDTENPHEVTAEQVGLGNVPNVKTNDQTPTFTTATTLTELTSGAKLNVTLGKIAKAIKDLISHISNKDNPHKVTASQISAVTTSKIANNLTTTGSGYVLDARQGKNLYEKMQNIKLGTILARGSDTSLTLSAGVITKIPLTVSDVKNPGCLANGNKYNFELTEDGGIKCPYTGFVLVSGAAYISGKSGNETARGCYIKRKTANGSGEYGEEMEVCSQLIRDLGGTGGVHAGTLAIAVQDADIFYLYARSSSASTCNPSNVATYLSLTYLVI